MVLSKAQWPGQPEGARQMQAAGGWGVEHWAEETGAAMGFANVKVRADTKTDMITREVRMIEVV